MAADTLELRLATLLRIRCTRSTRRTPSHRPSVPRERVNHRLVLCHRRHRCQCVLKQCACTLKAGRWAHSALAGAERACMHLVRPLADTPCSRSLPICGRIGVSRSILCSGLLPSGGASQTNMVLACPCARSCSHVRIPSARPCVQFRCPSAPSLAAHLAARSSPIGGAGDMSRHSCRTMPKNPIHLGKSWHGFHGAVRQSCPGRICFRGPPSLRCAVERAHAWQ
jgi:hypothetical protein